MGIVTTIAPIALALIMLGLGASLTVKDFTRVASNPKDFFIGIILSASITSNCCVFFNNYFKNSS